MKSLLIVVLAVMFAGCQTSRHQSDPGNPHPKKVVFQKDDGNRLNAKQTLQYLRVRVNVAASGDSAADKKLAEIVGPNVQKALRDAGFDVVHSGDAEIEVSGVARCLAGMSRGNRTVCRGSLELTVKRMDVRNHVTGKEIRRIVNVKRFDAKSGEAWTQEESVVSLGDNLTASVGKWLRESCASMVDSLARCNIAVNSVGAHSRIEKDYPTEFSKAVLGIQGVYACRVTSMNQNRTRFTASVLYDARQIPDGILNRLMSMPALNLK